ncbi:chalcone-flavanone isomerase-domain-containing protein [Dipodascopsis tothii]|uniref:chalcone-flavanone isomerase-domain-containing protein n=1 Tax=Dipodascopsis tothii TaxID=44089 RepID=UPI0034CF9C2F
MFRRTIASSVSALARQMPVARRQALAAGSRMVSTGAVKPSIARSRLAWVAAVGTVGAAVAFAGAAGTVGLEDESLLKRFVRASYSGEDGVLQRTVQPDTGTPPFAIELDSDGQESVMVALGIRTVSFLKIHVYALGIYMAKNDFARLQKVLASKPEYTDASALIDPTTGPALVQAILDAGVDLTLLIVPVRATSFSHLRDGFVRAVMGSARFKALEQSTDAAVSEAASAGLDDLRTMFSRKMSVPKHRKLFLHRRADGTLACKYENGSGPSPEVVDLGVISSRPVADALVQQYLSGETPSSEQARNAFVDSVVRIAQL